MKRTGLVAILTLALCGSALVGMLAGCSSDSETQTPDTPDSVSKTPPPVGDQPPALTTENARDTIEKSIKYTMSDVPFDLAGEPVNVGGLTFVPAIQWEVLEMTAPRMAHYAYGPLESDNERAFVSVYFHGSGQGPLWRDQFDRWLENMNYPEGRDPHGFALEHDRMVGGMKAHVLSIMGPLNRFTDEPKDPSSSPEAVCRVAAVAVEAPEGTVFFRLSGQDYTARIMTEAFMTMIYKLKKTTP